MESHAKPSAAVKTDVAFDLLYRDILTGMHAPGTPLRIAALSALSGASATPLREACADGGVIRPMPFTAAKLCLRPYLSGLSPPPLSGRVSGNAG